MSGGHPAAFLVLTVTVLNLDRFKKHDLKEDMEQRRNYLKLPSQDAFKIRNHSSELFPFLSQSHYVLQTIAKFMKVAQSCPTLCDPMGYPVHGEA